MSRIVVHVVLMCSCGEEEVISGDVRLVVLCRESGRLVCVIFCLFVHLFCYVGKSQIGVLGSEPRWVVGVEIPTDYEFQEFGKEIEVWIIVWGEVS